MALSLVAYGDSSESESEEASVPEKKESNTDVRKLLSVLPPAKSKSGRGKQPVRIGLPKLEKGVSRYSRLSSDKNIVAIPSHTHYLYTA